MRRSTFCNFCSFVIDNCSTLLLTGFQDVHCAMYTVYFCMYTLYICVDLGYTVFVDRYNCNFKCVVRIHSSANWSICGCIYNGSNWNTVAALNVAFHISCSVCRQDLFKPYCLSRIHYSVYYLYLLLTNIYLVLDFSTLLSYALQW